MGSLVSETLIRYFWNNYSKWALKSQSKDLQPGFPHSVRSLCRNFKKLRRKRKKTVPDVCYLYTLFQNAPPKVLQKYSLS